MGLGGGTGWFRAETALADVFILGTHTAAVISEQRNFEKQNQCGEEHPKPGREEV